VLGSRAVMPSKAGSSKARRESWPVRTTGGSQIIYNSRSRRSARDFPVERAAGVRFLRALNTAGLGRTFRETTAFGRTTIVTSACTLPNLRPYGSAVCARWRRWAFDGGRYEQHCGQAAIQISSEPCIGSELPNI